MIMRQNKERSIQLIYLQLRKWGGHSYLGWILKLLDVKIIWFLHCFIIIILRQKQIDCHQNLSIVRCNFKFIEYSLSGQEMPFKILF